MTYDIFVNSSIFMKHELSSFAFVIKKGEWTICRHAAPITNYCRNSTEAELMAIGHAINYIRLKGNKTASIRIHCQSLTATRHINMACQHYRLSPRCVALVELIRSYIYSDIIAEYAGQECKEIRWCDYHSKKINIWLTKHA